MPYLPPDFAHDTLFPLPFDKDLRMQIRLIDEMSHRMFPRIRYYSLLRTVGIAQPDTTAGGPAPVGAPGQSAFDLMWGESVDPVLAGQSWQQPHLNPVVQATNEEVERFLDPIEFRARVQREAKDYDLKRYGFDEMRDLLVHVPTYTLDRHGLTVAPGDMFIWNGEEFTVLQDKGSGYWKNTNVKLWRGLMCESRKRGS